jgi:hypothetical protein
VVADIDLSVTKNRSLQSRTLNALRWRMSRKSAGSLSFRMAVDQRQLGAPAVGQNRHLCPGFDAPDDTDEASKPSGEVCTIANPLT